MRCRSRTRKSTFLASSAPSSTRTTCAILGEAILPELLDEDTLAGAVILEISPGQTYVEAMSDWVDWTFMNEGLPSFEGGFEMGLDDLGAYLQTYGIDPYDEEGRSVIAHFIDQ